MYDRYNSRALHIIFCSRPFPQRQAIRICLTLSGSGWFFIKIYNWASKNFLLNCQISVVSIILWIFQVCKSKVRDFPWQEERKSFLDNLICTFLGNNQCLDHLAGRVSGMEPQLRDPGMASDLLPRSVGQHWKGIVISPQFLYLVPSKELEEESVSCQNKRNREKLTHGMHKGSHRPHRGRS